LHPELIDNIPADDLRISEIIRIRFADSGLNCLIKPGRGDKGRPFIVFSA